MHVHLCCFFRQTKKRHHKIYEHVNTIAHVNTNVVNTSMNCIIHNMYTVYYTIYTLILKTWKYVGLIL